MNIGIGFITGRPNVCNIINNYYKKLMRQLKSQNDKIIFYILYDLKYKNCKKEDFYHIDKNVENENVSIKYISTEDIQYTKKELEQQYHLNTEETDLFIGNGYGRARNTILYYSLKDKIDYLLFWDDDEYPVACMKRKDELEWIEQNNLLEHLKYIDNCDITVGNRCGYMSPIPYVELGKKIKEEDFKTYIEAVSNEAVSWEYIKKQMYTDKGITYAKQIKEAKTIKNVGTENWLLGSGICLNLTKLSRIPAFYNPPFARGEDAFFSTWLKNSKIINVPIYHFHDGFLQYTEIMEENYPKCLQEVSFDNEIEKRFLEASRGWVKYKPLLIYILERNKYTEKMEEMREKLQISIPKMNKAYENLNFDCLLQDLKEYSSNVEKHYEEYLKVNEIWNTIKKCFY